jgi:hypothetical protein
MRHHIDVLGWLHMVWGAFGALAGISLGILATGTYGALAAAGAIGGAPRAAIWLMAATSLLMIVGGIAQFAIGRRLRRLEARARLAAITVAFPNLLLIPFGTALGVYAFWVLLNNDARSAFGWPPRGALR